MKILVFSDSHGRPDLMLAAAELERPDHVFFLGDGLRDAGLLASLQPRLPINAVRGNCDWGEDQPLTRLVELEGFRFFLTHGHMQGVKSGLDELAAAGRQAGADLVCFGHTHVPFDGYGTFGVRLLNPGTVGGPYGQRTTYGVITAEPGVLKTEIKEDADPA